MEVVQQLLLLLHSHRKLLLHSHRGQQEVEEESLRKRLFHLALPAATRVCPPVMPSVTVGKA